MTAWLSAFALTQLVETPIYMRALAHRTSLPERALLAFGASALTHPIVFWIFPRLFALDYWAGVAAAELFAVAVEALYLSRLGVERSVLWSLMANGASVVAGLSSRAAFGWP